MSKPLQKGDKVVMHSCLEAETHGERVWTVRSNEWECSGNKVVLLEGFSGGFAVNFLRRVEPKPFALTEKQLQKITPVMKDFLERLERGGIELQNHKEDTIHFTAIDHKHGIVIRVFDNYGAVENPCGRAWAVDFCSKSIGNFQPDCDLGCEPELVNRLSELYLMATDDQHIATYQQLQGAIKKLAGMKDKAINLSLMQRHEEIRQLVQAVEVLSGGGAISKS